MGNQTCRFLLLVGIILFALQGCKKEEALQEESCSLRPLTYRDKWEGDHLLTYNPNGQLLSDSSYNKVVTYTFTTDSVCKRTAPKNGVPFTTNFTMNSLGLPVSDSYTKAFYDYLHVSAFYTTDNRLESLLYDYRGGPDYSKDTISDVAYDTNGNVLSARSSKVSYSYNVQTGQTTDYASDSDTYNFTYYDNYPKSKSYNPLENYSISFPESFSKNLLKTYSYNAGNYFRYISYNYIFNDSGRVSHVVTYTNTPMGGFPDTLFILYDCQ